MTKLVFASMLAAVCLPRAALAQSATLFGSQVTVTVELGGNPTSYPNTQTVGPGIEFLSGSLLGCCGYGNPLGVNIDVGMASIDFNYTAGTTVGVAGFDGYVFNFSASGPAITGVSLDPLSTFNSSQVGLGFGPHEVTVNVEGLSITPSSRITVDLNLAAQPLNNIAVANFSFEVLPPGGLTISCVGGGTGCAYSRSAIPGWTNSGMSGQFQQGSNTIYFNYIPDGITIAYSNDVGGTITQTVGTVVEANTTYTLQVDLGLRKDGEDSLGTVELLVGSTPVYAGGVAPTLGNWSTFTATYTSQAADIGKPLTIQLTATGEQSDFDNVRLISSSSPFPTPNIGAVANAASSQGGPVSPGEIISIFGSNIGPATPVSLQLDQSGKVATTLGGVEVLMNGVACPLTYVSAGQINAVVPFEITGVANLTLLATFSGKASSYVSLTTAASAPALFTDSSGTGQGAILNQDFTPNGPTNPAARGSVIAIYATGGGQTIPNGVDGMLATGPSQLTLPVVVGIDNAGVQVLYAGNAPGLVEGVIQIDALIPDDAPIGPAVPISIKIGDSYSQANVTVAIR
ncbi:MAG: hypothetical protein ABSE86_34145 [Bryobacteraceae bacterium]|jgi:uncharacterized protein (TIGR03437 family)